MILRMMAVISLCVAAPALGADKDAVLGVWLNQEKDAHIEIVPCDGTFCGRIVWLKEPNYPEGSKDGVPGTPKLDHNNPDPALRKTPVIGLVMMHGFEYAGDNLWKGGKVYDPKNGKTYSGKLRLISRNQLDLRGYIGISLLGRTAAWTRVEVNQ